MRLFVLDSYFYSCDYQCSFVLKLCLSADTSFPSHMPFNAESSGADRRKWDWARLWFVCHARQRVKIMVQKLPTARSRHRRSRMHCVCFDIANRDLHSINQRDTLLSVIVECVAKMFHTFAASTRALVHIWARQILLFTRISSRQDIPMRHSPPFRSCRDEKKKTEE